MKNIRTILLGVGAAMMSAGAAVAGDHGTMPANYQTALETYVGSRLTNPRGARFRVMGRPYQVYVDFRGRENVAAWAVDVRVRARLPSGGTGASSYTVIFMNGAPVALERDIRDVSRA